MWLATLHGLVLLLVFFICIYWRIFQTCTAFVNAVSTIHCYVPFFFLKCSGLPNDPQNRGTITQHMTDIGAGVTPICPLWWANYFLTCLLAVLSNATSSIPRLHNACACRVMGAVKQKRGKLLLLVQEDGAPLRASRSASSSSDGPGWDSCQAACLLASAASSIPPSRHRRRVQEV